MTGNGRKGTVVLTDNQLNVYLRDLHDRGARTPIVRRPATMKERRVEQDERRRVWLLVIIAAGCFGVGLWALPELYNLTIGR